MGSNLKTGNVDSVVDLLRDFRRVETHDSYSGTRVFLELGSSPKTKAAYAKMAEEKEGLGATGRQKKLIETQLSVTGGGYRRWTLSTNMYGWAVGCTMLSNIQGGKWAKTSRGATLEECLKYGYAKTRLDENVFSVSFEQLPEEVRKGLES